MKKLGSFPSILGVLILMMALLESCSLRDESTPTAESTSTSISIEVPTPAEPSATAEPTVTAAPNSDDVVVTTDVAPTDVVSVIITAAEATLYGGPGEDFPVVATAFGGSNYPVTGVSGDNLWWRLTCFDDTAIVIDECWVSADPAIAIRTESTAMLPGSEIKPYIELTFNFLRAIQSGLTAAGSEEYLSRDLQRIVEAGRPLPTLLGIRDALPSFAMTDFSDSGATRNARVRVRFNYDSPTYAIVNLTQEDGEWRIDKVAAHNLVKTFSTAELMQAEEMIIAYYEALANGEAEDAYELLASERQQDSDPEALSSIAEGLDKLTVSTLQPVRSAADQLVYYVRLLAVPDESQTEIRNRNWRLGENARWLTLVREEDGWRIARIINSPLLTEIASWQRVNVLPINMTLDIPADWTRAGLQWAWSPNSLGTPGIGVTWTDLGQFGGDETLLPRYRREISNQPLDLGWAQGTQYTFELMGGPGEGPIGAETHKIVKTGRRAYDFYAIANTVEELENVRPILQRMVAAVGISDPGASAFNSVETSVNFLATLLRDASGASSLPYLSEDLRASVGDQSSLLALLGADTVYQSFNASWQENPAAGQARVAVTLNFADSTEKLVFVVQRDSNDLWLIADIVPLE